MVYLIETLISGVRRRAQDDVLKKKLVSSTNSREELLEKGDVEGWLHYDG